MSAISNYLENALVNAVLLNVSYSSPATVYVALYTVDPTDTDTGTEVAGGSYARQPIAFDAPTDGVTQNTALLTFPTATADWGVVSHIGLCDAVSGGNLLFHASMNTAIRVLNTETFSILAGELVTTLT